MSRSIWGGSHLRLTSAGAIVSAEPLPWAAKEMVIKVLGIPEFAEDGPETLSALTPEGQTTRLLEVFDDTLFSAGNR